ncbi:MAG: hypothetical protein A2W35_20365 [Chloroflexi bacterium RBG_16_57_11]|nr:MAG: hypothetical protein A2W35_20365 [Chloroflexi bacterium RBG_16_57_11]
MMNAKPYPLELSGSGMPSILSDQDFQPTGKPVFIEGVLPQNERADSKIIPSFSLGGEGSLEPSGYTYPAPFTRYENFNKYKNYPYITVGKLFFTQSGVNYVCSAASIGNYAIWTAGHCVHAGDGSSYSWSYNVVFVPGYQNGKALKGQWKYYNLWTKTDWYYNRDYRYDMGGALLKKKDGYKISQKVGNLGFAYNVGLNKHWHVIGYPAAAPFNGLTQQICTASYAYSDAAFGSPYPSAIGCDLTGGASGGPWITNFGGLGYGNYLNGNNSYRHLANIYEMYTPYFGDAAYALYYQLVTSVVP